MSLIIAPNGFSRGRTRETLTKEEVELVQKFEAWCNKRRLALDLICKDCVEAGDPRRARLFGDNSRDGLSYHMTCGHADRIYGDGTTRG